MRVSARALRATIAVSATLAFALVPAVALADATDDVPFPAPVRQVDASSPPNALIASDGSGYYAIAPDSDFRDPKTGELVRDRPSVAPVRTGRGAHLRVRSGGEIGEVLLPHGHNGWLDLGDGIRVRLAGRHAASYRAKAGEVYYTGALTGVDQRFTLDGATSSVEEWLIVDSAAADRRAFRWTLSLPRSMRARQRGDEIRVSERSSRRLVLTITAPVAIDEADLSRLRTEPARGRHGRARLRKGFRFERS